MFYPHQHVLKYVSKNTSCAGYYTKTSKSVWSGGGGTGHCNPEWSEALRKALKKPDIFLI